MTVAPFGAWTGITLAEERARSVAPYDVGLELLAARPAPRRARPALGFFDVHGRAAITVQPPGLRSHIHWLVWEPGTGVVPTPSLTPLRLPLLLSGTGAPVDLLVTVLGLLGLPGRDLLVRGDSDGAHDVEPSVRGVMAFDRLMAEEGTHQAEVGGR